VADLPLDSVRPAPDMGAATSASCLTGIGLLDERMLTLIDVERLSSSVGIGRFDSWPPDDCSVLESEETRCLQT